MRVLGIDFGTSNTVAMLRTPDGRVRPLLFDGSPLLPSAVYLGTDGRMVVGRDAERNARVDPSRFEPNPKRRVDDGTIFLGDRELPVTDVFATVLGTVATEARRQIGSLPDEVRMTHPARWAERRRNALIEGAVRAGLPRPKLIAEPVAAASYFTAELQTSVPVGRSLAIYDLGGGTFDATVVRRTAAGFEVLAEGGLPDVGGVDFDHAVIEHLGHVYSRTNGDFWQRLQNPLDATDRRNRRMLWEDVRGAKEMLSRTTSADIHLPAMEIDAHLTRDELERLIRPYLERTVNCLTTTITEAHLTPRDLVGIFLVGGSSRIPLAAHLIHSQLQVAPTALEQPETVVAEGSLRVGTLPGEDSARTTGRPVSAPVPPRSGPPMRPATGPQVSGAGAGRPVAAPTRPVSGPPPHVQRPPSGPPASPAGPMRTPMPPRVANPVPPRPAAPVPPKPVPAQKKSWYQEPAVVVTLIVALVLLLGFFIVLCLAIGSSAEDDPSTGSTYGLGTTTALE
ncbi:Hsp70 family protein [Cryptosporangium aurantiacum]|uniref:Hsp70 protein n=1 Tax=Cryptosporangium aurantiacum TaxID=134849 RepID=A0A1M7RIP0_9ACTN|nr:Hsp70 family protein [Cryptosporangium aurantiacum]SHN46011.1 Hsp70 protein [Cryptosporangium aurantiacum]